MAGDIFYSEVDKNLQIELKARALAGSKFKTERELEFMTGKITNVQLTAFQSPKLADYNLAKNNDGSVSKYSILGGKNVRAGDYITRDRDQEAFLIEKSDDEIPGYASNILPTLTKVITKQGYLNDSRQANRIPPVITLCEVNIGDGSMGLLNKASVNILISDPSADLDEFENVWFRPGRHVLLEFAGNKEQIITRDQKSIDGDVTYGLLEPPNTRTGKIFAEKYSEYATERGNQIRNMNKILFDGVITSFTFSYQIDGTVDVNLQFSGTSNVYTDVELLLPKKDKDSSDKSENKEVNTLLKFIEDLVHNEVKSKAPFQTSLKKFNISFDSEYGEASRMSSFVNHDHGIMIGELYREAPDIKEGEQNLQRITKAEEAVSYQHQNRYIQLGLLITILNKEILSKLERKDPNDPKAEPAIVNARVVCNTEICQSTYYNDLVSSNPTEILLFTPDGNDHVYPNELVTIPPTDTEISASLKAGKSAPEPVEYEPVRLMERLDIQNPESKFHENDICFPSRIYIEVDNVIKPILEDPGTKTANDFLKLISKKINWCTGGAIALTLITDPKIADQLLFYDRNFIGNPDSVKAVNARPFVIPMSAKSSLSGPGEIAGSIVTDLKLSSKLPADLQSLAFVLNEGSELSSQTISPFITFMYAQGSVDDPDSQKFKVAKSYNESHTKFVENLEQAKALLTKDFQNYANINRLQKSLVKYLKYPTPNITKSNTLNAPIYPFDAELTIEGVSGFKYGDVVIIPILPERYKSQTVFSIIGIDQTIDSAGQWTTKLRLIMRPKIT